MGIRTLPHCPSEIEAPANRRQRIRLEEPPRRKSWEYKIRVARLGIAKLDIVSSLAVLDRIRGVFVTIIGGISSECTTPFVLHFLSRLLITAA